MTELNIKLLEEQVSDLRYQLVHLGSVKTLQVLDDCLDAIGTIEALETERDDANDEASAAQSDADGARNELEEAENERDSYKRKLEELENEIEGLTEKARAFDAHIEYVSTQCENAL